MTTPDSISDRSVNDLLRAAPAAGAIFSRFGVDTCCGGALPLSEAARQAGAPLDKLVAELSGVLATAADRAAR